jgi:hypothetical protein
MAEARTRPSAADVGAFLGSVDPARRADCVAIVALMQRVTGEPPKLWGSSIVGFGSYRMTYADGRTGEWPLAGFSPRAQALTLYVMSGFAGADTLLARLGRFKTGKSCLYVKRLADIDAEVLESLVKSSVTAMRKKYPASST